MQAHLPHIRLEQFEGPFDLLIELARSRQLELSEVSLREVTDAFLEYIRESRMSPELIGDFLVVAATLLLLKVQQLLPRLSEEEQSEVEELTNRVQIYRYYRQEAEAVRAGWGRASLLPARAFAPVQSPAATTGQAPEISSGGLALMMGEVVKRLPKPVSPQAHLRRQGRALPEILALFRKRLGTAGELVFQQAVRGAGRREAAVSFLAVLELARTHNARLVQERKFDDLIVTRI